MGFLQVRLEVVAISCNNIATFVWAGKASLSISAFYLIYQKPSSG